ncbi:hypothetical protein Tco_0200987 [Tanacetum coccineum]
MLDHMVTLCNTKIFIDNESTICIVKNPVFHSKTKHIEIRQHFIRDSNEKKLIQMIKIHTDQNVADLLTKAFDVSIFQYMIATEHAQMMLETAADDAIQVSTVGLTYYWRHLKLEDSDGISNLPTTEIFEQLALIGPEVKTAGDSVDDIAAESLVYIRRSAAKTKDKGKGIMEESELKTVSKVPDTKDTIKFKLDTQEITYIVDMFRNNLHLPVETLDKPFIAPVNIKVIEFVETRRGVE